MKVSDEAFLKESMGKQIEGLDEKIIASAISRNRSFNLCWNIAKQLYSL